MAVSGIYIDNGINVDPLWSDHIAVSYDGIKWTGISKHSLDVVSRSVSGNSTNRSVDNVNSFRIYLKRGEDSPLLDFDIQNVKNQPGWTVSDPSVGCLAAVADIIGWLSSAGSGGATATEATLVSVLAAIQDHQDFELKMVRDTGNGDKVVCERSEYDETAGTYSYSYTDVGGAAYVPVGALEYLDPSAVLNLILTELTTGATYSNQDISGAASTIIAANTVKSIELIVVSGTVTLGSVIFPVGVFPISAPMQGKILNALDFNAAGSTAYLQILT